MKILKPLNHPWHCTRFRTWKSGAEMQCKKTLTEHSSPWSQGSFPFTSWLPLSMCRTPTTRTTCSSATPCENFKNFLPLRFYVKSILLIMCPVWNFSNFPATQILREINFGWFQKVKTVIFTILETLNFDFLKISQLKMCKITKKLKFRTSKIVSKDNF